MKLSAVTRHLSRLAPRIYLVSLAQVIVIVAGTVTFLVISKRPPFQFEETMDFVARSIADAEGDQPRIEKILGRAHAAFKISLAVYDQQNHLVASGPSVIRPAAVGERPSSGDPWVPVRLKGGVWHLAFVTPRQPPPIPARDPFLLLVVVVLGVGSILMARSIARPLERLAETARAFGAGKLQARAQLRRSDELGEVAIAFDNMADRVSRALRVEKELLANVSHELRTPLQRIHIAMELAAEGDAATARESLSEIAEDLAELDRIVDDVLTATRLSLQHGGAPFGRSAAPPIRLGSVDLRALVEWSAARFRAAHPSRNLRVNVATDLSGVRADPVLLRRVIDNLLDNADKYTDDPAADIMVLVLSSDGKVVVEVQDRGIGIAPDDLSRVFQPFFRADRSRARTTGGLGLGLALSRQIVEAHQGQLTIESVVGRGTTARIELPI